MKKLSLLVVGFIWVMSVGTAHASLSVITTSGLNDFRDAYHLNLDSYDWGSAEHICPFLNKAYVRPGTMWENILSFFGLGPMSTLEKREQRCGRQILYDDQVIERVSDLPDEVRGRYSNLGIQESDNIYYYVASYDIPEDYLASADNPYGYSERDLLDPLRSLYSRLPSTIYSSTGKEMRLVASDVDIVRDSSGRLIRIDHHVLYHEVRQEIPDVMPTNTSVLSCQEFMTKYQGNRDLWVQYRNQLMREDPTLMLQSFRDDCGDQPSFSSMEREPWNVPSLPGLDQFEMDRPDWDEIAMQFSDPNISGWSLNPPNWPGGRRGDNMQNQPTPMSPIGNQCLMEPCDVRYNDPEPPVQRRNSVGEESPPYMYDPRTPPSVSSSEEEPSERRIEFPRFFARLKLLED